VRDVSLCLCGRVHLESGLGDCVLCWCVLFFGRCVFCLFSCSGIDPWHRLVDALWGEGLVQGFLDWCDLLIVYCSNEVDGLAFPSLLLVVANVYWCGRF